MTNQQAEALEHSHYEYHVQHGNSGILELLWIDEDTQDLAVLCEIDVQEYDPDGTSEYMERDDWEKETTFDAHGYLSNTEIHIEILVQYAHAHGLIKFDLRRELENMGFHNKPLGSSRFGKKNSFVQLDGLLFFDLFRAGQVSSSKVLEIPTTYDQFLTIKAELERLMKEGNE